MRVAVYCRISQDRNGAGLGVERQEADCRALAATLGWDVVSVHTDNDMSAYSGKRRPGYEALLDALRNDLADAVIAWHTDRLHRHTRELEAFIEIIEASGAKVVTVKAGNIDLATAAGRMTARLLGAVARGESEHKSERQRRKNDQLAAEGKMTGRGKRAFGYTPDRTKINKREAKLIREAADRILAGETQTSIARDWNRRGIATATGRQWTSVRIRDLLISPHVAGLKVHRGQVVGKAAWEPILDEFTYRRLQQHLSGRTSPPQSSSLLQGLLVCGVCGDGRLTHGVANTGKPIYRCARTPGRSGCDRCSIVAEPLEAFVTFAAINLLANGALAKTLQAHTSPEPVQRDLADQIGQLRQSRSQLVRDRIVLGLDAGDFLQVKTELDGRITELEARLSAVTSADAVVGLPDTVEALQEHWETLTTSRQRAVLRVVVGHIVIGPAVRGLNFFDHRRVSIAWIV